jgi:cardiolipin synthase
MASWEWWYFVAAWGIRVVMIPVLMLRRQPTVAMAWLLVIFFQPVAGLIIFGFFGTNRLPRRRIIKHKRIQEAKRSLARLALIAPHVAAPRVEPEHVGLLKLSETLSENRLVGGNDVKILSNPSEMLDLLIADIDAAKNHVHLLYYIFEDDAVGRRVAEALARAVERGVECRLLADSVGSWEMFKRLGPWMSARGIKVVEMLVANPFRRRFARIDLRNHRKLAVIDGATAYTGSQNVNDPMGAATRRPWYEVTARLRGPVVVQLQNVFLEDWYFDTDEVLDGPGLFPQPKVEGDVPVQTLPSGPTYETESYERLVVSAIHAAQRRVMITTPYLVPDETLLVALQTAVLRGVRVQLIVPRKSDLFVTDTVGRAYFHSLLVMGVEVYQHTDGILHSKTMTIDDEFCLIGSGNFDIRSFKLNFELNLLLYGQGVTAELRRLQESYVAQSVRVEGKKWQQRWLGKQMMDGCVQLFSPLL